MSYPVSFGPRTPVGRAGFLAITVCLTATAGSPAADPAPAEVEVRLVDDSAMKVRLLDDKIELDTPYGPLRVPARDVVRIVLSPRLSDAEQRAVEAAVADWVGRDGRKREAAKAVLLRYGPRALAALERAATGPDSDAKTQAETLLAELRPDEDGPPPGFDLVVTKHSQIAGRLTAAALQVRTAQFGDKPLKLADVRSVRNLAVEPAAPAEEILDGPPSLSNFGGQIGKTLAFRVTGVVGGGSVWGTGTYTLDSSFPTAAVHAGAVALGQTAVVRVRFVPSPPGYAGSSKNGVTTNDYPFYPPGAYEFLVGKKKR